MGESILVTAGTGLTVWEAQNCSSIYTVSVKMLVKWAGAGFRIRIWCFFLYPELSLDPDPVFKIFWIWIKAKKCAESTLKVIFFFGGGGIKIVTDIPSRLDPEEYNWSINNQYLFSTLLNFVLSVNKRNNYCSVHA